MGLSDLSSGALNLGALNLGALNLGALAVLLSLSGCSINPENLSPYEQAQLACTLQVGQQPESQISIAGYKIFSFGFSAPAESEQEEEYDRRRMEYQECMRSRGF
ncbi:hypothetical protein BFW38_04045 [Terasakiispira papahanaumokuakeensis]|uniref:Uncharacterized protein n=1 Tax=Terasakiispira papahanaumokuakeensis TaxID=197479 RepID=A0A1E2V7N3_9GAMM|nr:hypothetical protein [Terasakiispira papahanaumokuakeensis]ODC02846.1 hypothetical protein BFW38_04045 [Terasakiispira papahanaumokuakeensis]